MNRFEHIQQLLRSGLGITSRDLCFIDNAEHANLRAATSAAEDTLNKVDNVAVGSRTRLTSSLRQLREALAENGVHYGKLMIYRDLRAGDVSHWQADIGAAERLLRFAPPFDIHAGIGSTPLSADLDSV